MFCHNHVPQTTEWIRLWAAGESGSSKTGLQWVTLASTPSTCLGDRSPPIRSHRHPSGGVNKGTPKSIFKTITNRMAPYQRAAICPPANHWTHIHGSNPCKAVFTRLTLTDYKNPTQNSDVPPNPMASRSHPMSSQPSTSRNPHPPPSVGRGNPCQHDLASSSEDMLETQPAHHNGWQQIRRAKRKRIQASVHTVTSPQTETSNR